MTIYRQAICAFATLSLVCCALPADAQRIQFGSPAPATITPVQNGTTFATPGNTYSAPGATFSTPGGTVTTPGATLTTPPATFQGNVIQPQWDPYANPANTPPMGQPFASPGAGTPNPYPYSQQPGSIFPDGAPSVFAGDGYAYSRPDGTVGSWPRLFQEVRFEYTWIAGLSGSQRFDISKLEANVTMQFAFFYNQAPLLVTPGFAIRYLDGPDMTIDMPPRLYDTYLDFAWKPQVTPWLSADLGVRVGLYTDFAHTTTDSFRVMGRGLGIIGFSPNLQLALGVVYFDRHAVKLLPAGGVIWTPNEDVRVEVIFPRPKFAYRFTTIGTTDWFWTVSGELGGGQWTVERAGGKTDIVDYLDYRVMTGLEFQTLSGVHGVFEVGGVFGRRLLSETDSVTFKPGSTVMLRGGIYY